MIYLELCVCVGGGGGGGYGFPRDYRSVEFCLYGHRRVLSTHEFAL